jgi:hypothetical protein
VFVERRMGGAMRLFFQILSNHYPHPRSHFSFTIVHKYIHTLIETLLPQKAASSPSNVFFLTHHTSARAHTHLHTHTHTHTHKYTHTLRPCCLNAASNPSSAAREWRRSDAQSRSRALKQHCSTSSLNR